MPHKGSGYNVTSGGTNSGVSLRAFRVGSTKEAKQRRGNHYCHRDYGSGSRNGNSYHYSNQDGSYYYKNPDRSTYYNDGKGSSTYTPPAEDTRK